MSRARARTSGSSSTMRMVSTSGLPRCELLGALRRPYAGMQVKFCRRSMYGGQGLEFQSKLLTSCWLRSSCHWRRAAARSWHAAWVSCTLSLTMSRGISGLLSSSWTHQRAQASSTVVRIFSTRPPRSPAGLADLAEPHHLGAAVHILAHLTPERLEILRSAMGVHGGLIGVALHEDVGLRRLAVVERVQLAAGLARIDLGHQILGHSLELLVHARLHLDGRDDAYHVLSPFSKMRKTRRLLQKGPDAKRRPTAQAVEKGPVARRR